MARNKWELKGLRAAFVTHRDNAKRRPVPFTLTFEQWLEIWEQSGHLDEYGRAPHEYCMGRIGDRGGYEVGNVYITTNEQNRQEYYERGDSLETRVRKSESGKIRAQLFPEQIIHLRANRGNNSETTRRKISESNTGRVGGFAGKRHSEATKEKQRANWRNQNGEASAKAIPEL